MSASRAAVVSAIGGLLAACGGDPVARDAERVGVATSALAWAQQALLTSLSAEGDRLGYAVALEGDLALVGVAPPDMTSPGDFGPGNVHLFQNDPGGWQEVQALLPSGSTLMGLGTAIAIDGPRIVLGVRHDNNDVGRAYVFERAPEGSFALSATLDPSPSEAGMRFGRAVDIEGDTIAVGSGGFPDGAVHVFELVNGAWSQTQRIAPTLDPYTGFGDAVSLSADTLLIGAPQAASGAAYVFVRNGAVWTQQAQLLGNTVEDVWFGGSVALRGNRALVGAPLSDHLGDESGAAYLYESQAGLWPLSQQLVASDGGPDVAFGRAVAITGDLAVIGAPRAIGTGRGSAYVFLHDGVSWVEDSELVGEVGVSEAGFGFAAAIDGERIIVGDPLGDTAVDDTGVAYIFGISGSGAPCTGPEACASGFCVDGVCCDSACGGGAADCQACSVAAGSSADGRCDPVPRGTACRPDGGACDAPEVCNGTSPQCPDDEVELDGIACDDGDACTLGDTCQAGVCSAGDDICPEEPIDLEGRSCLCRLTPMAADAAGGTAASWSWLLGLLGLCLRCRGRRASQRHHDFRADA